MALTSIATSDDYCVKVWHKGLEREIIRDLYFNKFMSGKDGPILMLDDLMGKAGDVIHYQLVKALTGDGISGNQTFEGKEEELLYYDDTVTLQLRGNAVSDDGPLSNQRVNFSVSEDAAIALKTWLAEKIDDDCFTALATSLTKCFYIDSDGAIAASTAATAKSGIRATTSHITPQLCRATKTWAKTGGEGDQPRLQPMKYAGGKHFVALMYPDAGYDLKGNSEWTQAVREAEARGKNNPLFQETLAMLDGIIFEENEGVGYFSNGGAGAVRGAHNFLLGRHALAFGWAKKPTISNGSSKYGLKNGKAIHALYGVTKTVFNSLDYAVAGITTDMSAISSL